jgi:hypothetical protein
MIKKLSLTSVVLTILLLAPSRAEDEESYLKKVKTLLPKDAIKAIDSPKFVTAAEAGRFMNEGSSIIGVALEGEAKAYPLSILSVHQVVNDSIKGLPIAVTWDPISYAAIVYDRRVGGRTLTFGLTGSLYANSFIMYDRETGSQWVHLSGEAIQGKLKGEKLRPIPSLHSAWGAWSRLHPGTLLLWQRRWGLVPYRQDTYVRYYTSEQTGLMPPIADDRRLSPKERVVGLLIGGKARAYPFPILEVYQVVNDIFEGRPVVVVFDRKTATAAVYLREVEGRVLKFSGGGSIYGDNPTIVDQETGSRWLALTGEGVEGGSAGKRLMQIAAPCPFWFIWVDHHPDTEIFKGGS